jgi:hypothetical protein
VHGMAPIGQRSQHGTAHDVIVLDEQHRGHAETLALLASNSLNGDALTCADHGR